MGVGTHHSLMVFDGTVDFRSVLFQCYCHFKKAGASLSLSEIL